MPGSTLRIGDGSVAAMARLSLIFLLAAACGGSSKPAQLAPLPDEPKPAAPAPAPAPPPPAPPAPPPPVEATLPAAQTTVKLVAGGRGKKAPLRYTPKAGTKQALELTMDFAGQQDTQQQIVPTIVLAAEAETAAVAADGATDFSVKVTGTDARAVEGSSVPLDKFKPVLASLEGLTFGGKRDATGVVGDLALKIEQPKQGAADALDLVRLTLPQVPVLPKEAIGVGAKWTATTIVKLANQIDVTQVTEYELVGHKDTSWTVKGKTKVSGKEQDIDGGKAKISDIKGTGTSELTIADGTLYPTYKSAMETSFKASPKDAADKSITFTLKVGGSVTPK
jgi:hypothetical protein